MIIDFEHSFEDYDKILNFYGTWDCSCPVCKTKYSMHRHGKYYRNLIMWENGHFLETGGNILRLRCSVCHSTHAILTMDMIPFFSYSLPALLFLVDLCSHPDNSVLKTKQQTGVSYQMLYRMISLLQEYHERLTILFQKKKSFSFFLQCFPQRRQVFPACLPFAFFQAYHFPVFLNRRVTKSFPLHFGFII